MLDPTSLDTSVHGSPLSARRLRKPVGITKGPGESTHEYTFVSRDDEQELKNGEYVYYELSNPEAWQGQAPRTGVIHHAPPVIATPSEVVAGLAPALLSPARRVLGRIIKRIPLKLYPDT